MIIRPSFAERYPFLICALSTRQGGVSSGSFGMNLSYSVGDDPNAVTENRRAFFGALGIPLDDLVLQRQVHGDTIRHVDGPGTWDDTDGLCTTSSRYLSVCDGCRLRSGLSGGPRDPCSWGGPCRVARQRSGNCCRRGSGTWPRSWERIQRAWRHTSDSPRESAVTPSALTSHPVSPHHLWSGTAAGRKSISSRSIEGSC